MSRTYHCSGCHLHHDTGVRARKHPGTTGIILDSQLEHFYCMDCAMKMGLLKAGAVIKNWNDPTKIVTPGAENASYIEGYENSLPGR